MPGFVTNLFNEFRSRFLPDAPLLGPSNPIRPEQRSLLNKMIGDRETYERFSPDAIKQIATEYLPNIGLGSNVTFNSDAFEKYMNGRTKGFLELKEAKTPADDLIYKKLSEEAENPEKNAAIVAVRNEINEIFNTTRNINENYNHSIEDAQKNYEESIAVFQGLVKKIPKDYKVHDLIGAMQDIVDTGIKSIEDQQKKEKDLLNEKFTDNEFRTNLQKALNVNADQLEQVKESMQADLEKAHKKQLDEFKKSSQNSMNTLHQAAEKQHKEFLFLADLHKNDRKMRIMIQALADKNRQELGLQPPPTVNLDAQKIDVASVSLDQLNVIQRLGGGKIKRITDETGAVSYKLDMSMRITSPLYYLNNEDEKDVLMIAQAVRATGAEGIIMNINFENSKIAEKRARNAYEACIKSGFPPDKIKLNVNGVMMTYKAMEKDGQKYESIEEKLYNKKRHTFNELQSKSQTIQAELKEISKGSKPTSGAALEEIKTEIRNLREAAQQPQPQPPQQQPQPQPQPGPQ